jgi:hypothetical protein
MKIIAIAPPAAILAKRFPEKSNATESDGGFFVL